MNDAALRQAFYAITEEFQHRLSKKGMDPIVVELWGKLYEAVRDSTAGLKLWNEVLAHRARRQEMRTVEAPFTPGQVAALEKYQKGEVFHPYTCCDNVEMRPTAEGLKCPKCGRLQTWVLDWSAGEG